MTATSRPRVLSGMRPTGPLHLGHLVGALENWVALQDTHECYFTIVDWHALTTDYADPSSIRGYVREVALDWLAAAIDPERATVFVQSRGQGARRAVTCCSSMIVPLPWLERVPTYKEQQEQLRDKDLNTYGFLGYPLLQSADILAVPRRRGARWARTRSRTSSCAARSRVASTTSTARSSRSRRRS